MILTFQKMGLQFTYMSFHFPTLICLFWKYISFSLVGIFLNRLDGNTGPMKKKNIYKKQNSPKKEFQLHRSLISMGRWLFEFLTIRKSFTREKDRLFVAA